VVLVLLGPADEDSAVAQGATRSGARASVGFRSGWKGDVQRSAASALAVRPKEAPDERLARRLLSRESGSGVSGVLRARQGGTFGPLGLGVVVAESVDATILLTDLVGSTRLASQAAVGAVNSLLQAGWRGVASQVEGQGTQWLKKTLEGRLANSSGDLDAVALPSRAAAGDQRHPNRLRVPTQRVRELYPHSFGLGAGDFGLVSGPSARLRRCSSCPKSSRCSCSSNDLWI
jgi:hypothetical protein